MTSFFANTAEFASIQQMFSQQQFSKDGRKLGDDGVIIPIGQKLFTITSDASVQNTHFRSDWCSLETAFEKCVISNLSDINAMGAKAMFLFLNLGIPPLWKQTDMKRIGKHFEILADKYEFKIGGGDTVQTENELFFSITAFGEITSYPLLRSNAKPGHRLFISNKLGRSSSGLHLLRNKPNPCTSQHQSLIDFHLCPSTPHQLGPILSTLSSEIAAIDISDGLSSELGHLAAQSDVKIIIQYDLLPYPDFFKNLFSKDLIRDFVLHGGEEYQLLFSTHLSDSQLKSISSQIPLTLIGRVEEGEGVFIQEKGLKPTVLLPQGWSHR